MICFTTAGKAMPVRVIGPQPRSGGGQVYWCYDRHAELLYIGSSIDARKRFKGRGYRPYSATPWCDRVNLLVIKNYPTRKAAYAAEAAAQQETGVAIRPTRWTNP